MFSVHVIRILQNTTIYEIDSYFTLISKFATWLKLNCKYIYEKKYWLKC